jgi:hypothetical protein
MRSQRIATVQQSLLKIQALLVRVRFHMCVSVPFGFTFTVLGTPSGAFRRGVVVMGEQNLGC